MTDTITYNVSMAVTGGPSVIAPAGTIEAEAWDLIEVTIEDSTGPITVDVQPGAIADMQGIIIMSDNYTGISFTVDSEMNTFVLDGPLMLIGYGNIGMLGSTLLQLNFTNADTNDAAITILVARQAVPT